MRVVPSPITVRPNGHMPSISHMNQRLITHEALDPAATEKVQTLISGNRQVPDNALGIRVDVNPYGELEIAVSHGVNVHTRKGREAATPPLTHSEIRLVFRSILLAVDKVSAPRYRTLRDVALFGIPALRRSLNRRAATKEINDQRPGTAARNRKSKQRQLADR